MFKVVDRHYHDNDLNCIYLEKDDWNDYSYYTLFHGWYYDNNRVKRQLGSIKIAKKGLVKRQYVSSLLPIEFEQLEDNFFSVWNSAESYEQVSALIEVFGYNIFEKLNDVAYNQDIYSSVEHEDVFITSFLRALTPHTIKYQFNRIAHGGCKLSPYKFTYRLNNITNDVLSFEVSPDSTPPTNIHAFIGPNGAGKTHLMNKMIDVLLRDEINDNAFEYDEEESEYFEGVFSVSFSPFDKPRCVRNGHNKRLSCAFLGLFNDDDKMFESLEQAVKHSFKTVTIECIQMKRK